MMITDEMIDYDMAMVMTLYLGYVPLSLCNCDCSIIAVIEKKRKNTIIVALSCRNQQHVCKVTYNFQTIHKVLHLVCMMRWYSTEIHELVKLNYLNQKFGWGLVLLVQVQIMYPAKLYPKDLDKLQAECSLLNDNKTGKMVKNFYFIVYFNSN